MEVKNNVFEFKGRVKSGRPIILHNGKRIPLPWAWVNGGGRVRYTGQYHNDRGLSLRYFLWATGQLLTGLRLEKTDIKAWRIKENISAGYTATEEQVIALLAEQQLTKQI